MKKIFKNFTYSLENEPKARLNSKENITLRDNLSNTKDRNSSTILLKEKRSDIGEQKYLPSFSKEWKNTIYSYNKEESKNIAIDYLNLNKLIKGYFTLYFKNNRFIYRFKNIALKKRRLFLKKIYVSDAEIKHTNNKAIITLYVFNPESKILRNKYKKINKVIKRSLLQKYLFSYKKKISDLYNFIMDTNNKAKQSFNYGNMLQGKENTLSLSSNRPMANEAIKDDFFKFALESLHAQKFILLKNLAAKRLLTWFIYKYKKKNLRYLRRYDLLYSLNEKKYGKSSLIPKLTSYLKNLSGFARKKIEYNVINLKSISYHPDLFINALILKLTRKRLQLHYVISRFLGITKLPKGNLIKERTYLKGAYLNSFINKYKDLKVLSNMDKELALNRKENKSNSLDSLLSSIHNSNIESMLGLRPDSPKDKIHPFIFNAIKYKNLGGMRLKINGRLTKRYRADRAVHLLKWKGGLKNIDSSFKRLSTVLYRGNTNSNNVYSWSKSKRRIGSFAVKGWISGK